MYPSALIFKYYIQFNQWSEYGNMPMPIPLNDVRYTAQIPYNVLEDDVTPYITSIGAYSFLNLPSSSIIDYDHRTSNSHPDHRKYGTGGPGVITEVDREKFKRTNYVQYPRTRDGRDLYAEGPDGNPDPAATRLEANKQRRTTAIHVYDIKRRIIGYGGNTYESRQNTVYQAIKSIKGTTGAFDIIYGGDTYVSILDYPHTMQFQSKNPTANQDNSMFVGCYVPFESPINCNLLEGSMAHQSVSGMKIDPWYQIEPCQIHTAHLQDRPYYAFNNTFTVIPESKPLATDDI
jgi:hypothetical protein